MEKPDYINEHLFKMALSNVNLIWVLHGIFLFFLLTGGLDYVLHNSRFYGVCTTLLLFLILKFRYSFRAPEKNAVIIIVYYVIVLFEMLFITIGFPEGGGPKGAFFNIVAAVVPYAYIGLRFVAAIPLFVVYYKSKKLSVAS
ncbi:MAG: hypothetical protein ACPGLV_02175 [Bacteroidia bacterium]